jgi:DNA polymerase I
MIAFDLETHLIQPGLLAPPVVCGSVATEAPNSERVVPAGEVVAHFRRALEEGIGGANIAYDLGVMAAHDPALLPEIFAALDAGKVHDTHIYEALHDIGRGCFLQDPQTRQPFRSYSLAQLETRYLGIDRSDQKKDGWRLRYALLDGILLKDWPQDAVAYPRADARGTYDVLRHQMGDSDRLNLQCAARDAQAAFALQLMSIWGVRTDPALVETVTAEIERLHEESRREFFRHGLIYPRACVKKKGVYEDADDISLEWLNDQLSWLGDQTSSWAAERAADVGGAIKALQKGKPLRFASDTARLEALVTAAYAGHPPLTPKGSIKRDRDTLSESGDELLERVAEAGPNEKLNAAFKRVLRQGTVVPINPQANVIVSTDRTSYREPNLQQLPRKGLIRECFVPRPGSFFCSVDYGTLELCTLAQVCLELFGASEMAKAINAGQDLHTRLVARIMVLDYEEAKRRRKGGDRVVQDLRQAMKEVNFGLPGLMGVAKLVLTARKKGVRFCELAGVSADCARNRRVTEVWRRPIPPTCEVCLELATGYRKLWYDEWPEMVDYHKAISAEIEAGNYQIESVAPLRMLRYEESPSAYANHLFQHRAAVGAKRALYRVVRECYSDPASVLFNACRPVVFLHDEILSEIREGVAHEAAHRKADIMVEAMREVVPDVQITAKPALCRRWFKGAEEVFDEKGRLQPWSPEDWKEAEAAA